MFFQCMRTLSSVGTGVLGLVMSIALLALSVGARVAPWGGVGIMLLLTCFFSIVTSISSISAWSDSTRPRSWGTWRRCAGCCWPQRTQTGRRAAPQLFRHISGLSVTGTNSITNSINTMRASATSMICVTLRLAESLSTFSPIEIPLRNGLHDQFRNVFWVVAD